MKFIERLEIPVAGNPYYNTKDNGGYSTAIKGKNSKTGTFHAGLSVLPNCVGWAFGRVNEIAEDKKMRILQPVNAENWVESAKNQGLKMGDEPKIGAVMCWKKGDTLSSKDGAGHVAIVEKVIDANTVVTSESGYNSTAAFYSKTRKRGTGNWGQSAPYKFRCFIYPPYTDILNPGEQKKDEETHLYRIRKNWNDQKSQIGAYNSLDNAKNACLAGYTVYDEHGVAVYSVLEKMIEKGDIVRIKKGALDYTGHRLSKFVYDREYVVSEIKGNRAVVKYNGVVVAAMDTRNLMLV